MKLVKKSDNVPEETGSLACQSISSTSDRDVLAGEASGDNSSFGNKSNCSQIVTGYRLHIIE
jgi:hypothetical protein